MQPIVERHLRRFTGQETCWEWEGARERNGYGIVATGSSTTTAHRAVWVALNGPVPDGLELDHLCRNRGCVNPSHLALVTHRENCAHMGRDRCFRGHERPPGTRCRECRKIRGN